ncbi:MAG: DUF488 domain-containing protein [Bryobacteraceae bacterium]
MSTIVDLKHRDFFTVGYQSYSADLFISDLKTNGVELLIDVRENPFSFKRGFSKSSLAAILSEARIGYAHRRELGTPKEIRDIYKGTGDATVALRRYEDYLSRNIHLLNWLLYEIQQKKVCILCVERDHNACHRGVIARKIQEIAEWATPVHIKVNG